MFKPIKINQILSESKIFFLKREYREGNAIPKIHTSCKGN